MANEYFDLLKEWTDAMLELQITGNKQPEFYGALLCPACGHIHGRSADAVYPFVYMSHKTGDTRYLDAAVRLVDWAENNVQRPNGGYFNDYNTTWMAITVFSAIGMAETLLHHGDFLPKDIYDKWYAIFKRQADFMFWYIDSVTPNINYYVSCAALFALAWKFTNEQKYLDRAKHWANYSINHIDQWGMLFGEGKPNDLITERGCRAIDIGYNVEESLPNLVTYCRITNDSEVFEKVKMAYKAHIELMLPDGGWDNSFGCRNPKWTYWGSRTSDGCQIGLAALADEDPVFAEAAHRNFELYKACTHNGLLHGGPMYIEVGERPCVHHTFDHAKALAFMLDIGFDHKKSVKLPREESYGVKTLPSAGATLVSNGEFLATFCNTDHGSFRATPTGGSMTLLWHKEYGPICAASMNEFHLVETLNMQWPRCQNSVFCQTPRLVYCMGNSKYISAADKNAALTINDFTLTATGGLYDKTGDKAGDFEIVSSFDKNTLTISVKSNLPCEYSLPIISSKKDTVTLSDGRLVVKSAKHGSTLVLSADNAAIEIDGDTNTRLFNPVGGFLTIPVFIKLKPNTPIVVKLTVE